MLQPFKPTLEVPALPGEIWKVIFLYTEVVCGEEGIKKLPCLGRAVLELEFRKLSCVSYTWSRLIHELARVHFQENKTVSNWVLRHFSDIEVLNCIYNSIHITYDTMVSLTNLKELSIRDNKHVPSSKAVQQLTTLTKLTLCYKNSITDECLKNLINLKSFSIGSVKRITDQGLVNMKCLEKLKIDSNENITDQGLEMLSSTLTTLLLHGKISITDVGLKKMTNLTKLDLLTSEISNDAVQSLVNLKSICIHTISKITFQGISSLKNLITLEIYSNPIKNKELNSMNQLTSLTLRSSRDKLTNKCLKDLTNLSKLNFSLNTYIDNDGIKNLPLLTNISINHRITVEGIMHLTALSSLQLSRNITDNGIHDLTNLIHLDLLNNENISDYGIMKLTKLQSLSNCLKSKITRNGICHLSRLLIPPILNESIDFKSGF